MKRVVGVGGVFFKARDPAALAAWYERHLGVLLEKGAPVSVFTDGGPTVWSIFAKDSTYFESDAPFMINYRVDDLDALLRALETEGVTIVRPATDSPEGRFAAIRDPDGNGIELWQAPAS
jgi:predicted enzyme related to lactoylglutathione lyase